MVNNFFFQILWGLRYIFFEMTFKTIQVQLNLFGWIITLKDVLRVYCMMKPFWAEKKKNQFCIWVYAWDYFCIYLSFFICVIGWARQGFQSINTPYFVKYFKYLFHVNLCICSLVFNEFALLVSNWVCVLYLLSF